MVDHLKRSKAALQKLLDEYWALRRKTCECLLYKRKKAEEELRLRFDLCITDGYMENIAKRLGINPSFLEKK